LREHHIQRAAAARAVSRRAGLVGIGAAGGERLQQQEQRERAAADVERAPVVQPGSQNGGDDGGGKHGSRLLQDGVVADAAIRQDARRNGHTFAVHPRQIDHPSRRT